MQSAEHLVLQFGQFAMLVIVGIIAMILFASLVDPHPRTRDSQDETLHAKKNPNEFK